MIISIAILLLLLIGWQGCLFWQAVGREPRGERLERCKKSPQWKDGAFQNRLPTPTLTGNDGVVKQMWNFLFKQIKDLRPSRDVPTLKTSLLNLPREEELCLWLGHSSVFVQTGGKRYLFDPVLTNSLPVWWFMRPFRGADVYRPEDIPEVDYLVITHDHWDHLDWKTVRALRPRVGQVVCTLGIGEHFEYWGYPREMIHDMDWNDSLRIDSLTQLRCLPTRHFSGRMGRHVTLWGSYLIDGPRRIFVSGDGGYDERFRDYGERFPGIDLAIMENGQYDEGWHFIHTLPRELPQAISELGPRRVLTYHHSKYALANHAWTEPLDSISRHAEGQPWQLLLPRIGEPVHLDAEQSFGKWW